MDDVQEASPGVVHLDEQGRPKIIEIKFCVEPDFHGYRLDHYLKRKIKRLSRTKIQEVIRTQLHWPDRSAGPDGAAKIKPHTPVAEGDRFAIRREARPEPICPRRFDVLHDEPDFLVVDKPAGLPVHATARYYFNTLTRLLFERYPGQGLQICHRLDRETSGCLVVARGREVAARLKGAFERRRVSKRYLALVHGVPAWDGEHEIDLPLALVTETRLKVRMAPREGGLPALTRVTVIDRGADCALVSCVPVTGRQHQIRAHLAAAGHPIVGDKLYAHGDEAFMRWCDLEARGEDVSEQAAAELGLARQALHAASITFPHPRTGEEITIESPLPAELRAYLDARRAGGTVP